MLVYVPGTVMRVKKRVVVYSTWFVVLYSSALSWHSRRPSSELSALKILGVGGEVVGVYVI